MFQLSEAELDEVYADAGWTGLPWSELRAIRVGDSIECRCQPA
jgi:hypothetical protein